MNATNCVLVSLNICHWNANRQDKSMSESIASANNVTDKSMCRLRKSLLPRSAALRRVYAAMAAARSFHYANTHAWMHDGPRVLMTKNVEPYMRAMRQFKNEFEGAVLELLNQYEQLKEDARKTLGALHKDSDYPPKEALKSRYSFDLKLMTMPAAAELMDIGLEPQDAEELRRKLEADMAETFAKANRRLWEDLYARLEKLYGKLADEKATVTNASLSAVQELVELLPRMNITNDEKLEALSTKLKDSLGGLSAENLKYDTGAREKARTEAQTVYHVMQAYMNPASRRAAPAHEAMQRAA